MSEDADLQRLKDACAQLGEHFDTVQIFVTRFADSTEEDGTVNAAWGTGNWFARYGQVKSWQVKQDEITRIDARNKEDDDLS